MVLRLALGTVYMAMAIGQLASAANMPRILAAYGLMDGTSAAILAGGLIVGELLCGAWFLTRPRSTAVTPVWAYTAVSLVWSALAVQAYVRGLTVTNCGCFGVYLTQRLTWSVLAQDALTLLYAALLVRGARRARATARNNPSDDTEHSQAAKADTR